MVDDIFGVLTHFEYAMIDITGDLAYLCMIIAAKKSEDSHCYDGRITIFVVMNNNLLDADLQSLTFRFGLTGMRIGGFRTNGQQSEKAEKKLE